MKWYLHIRDANNSGNPHNQHSAKWLKFLQECFSVYSENPELFRSFILAKAKWLVLYPFYSHHSPVRMEGEKEVA